MQPTDAQKQSGLAHVSYESVTLHEAAKALLSASVGDGRLTHVYLENALLHIRNLRDFFTAKRRFADDMIAGDYVEWDADKAKTRLPSVVNDAIKARLDKAVSHLSYARLEFAEEPKWPIAEMCDEMLQVWRSFVDKLPEHYRVKFHDGGRRFKEVVEFLPPGFTATTSSPPQIEVNRIYHQGNR